MLTEIALESLNGRNKDLKIRHRWADIISINFQTYGSN